MTTHIDFYDDTTNMLMHFMTVNLGLVKQGLSVGASQLQKGFVREFEKIEDTNWNSRWNKKGKRLLTHGQKKKNFGDMYYKGKDQQMTGKNGVLNLKNLIKFYTPSEITALYAVVLGGHPNFSPVKWEKGFNSGKMNRIGSTGQNTLDIFEKIDQGEKRKLSKKEAALFKMSLRKPNDKRSSPKFP